MCEVVCENHPQSCPPPTSSTQTTQGVKLAHTPHWPTTYCPGSPRVGEAPKGGVGGRGSWEARRGPPMHPLATTAPPHPTLPQAATGLGCLPQPKAHQAPTHDSPSGWRAPWGPKGPSHPLPPPLLPPPQPMEPHPNHMVAGGALAHTSRPKVILARGSP